MTNKKKPHIGTRNAVETAIDLAKRDRSSTWDSQVVNVATWDEVVEAGAAPVACEEPSRERDGE